MRRWFANYLTGPASLGLLGVRLVAGSAFMYHGWDKIQKPLTWMGPSAKMPGLLQALAALAEFGGGLAWILGLLTPLASLGILCTMFVAIVQVHLPKGDPFVPRPGSTGSYELALGYLAIAFMLLLGGPGVLSLDALIFGRKRPPLDAHSPPAPSPR